MTEDEIRTEAANAECARWVEAMKKLGFNGHPGLSIEENLRDFAMARETEELLILRNIARVAGLWGQAYAVLQLDPTPEARRAAAKVAREMVEAMAAYSQFLVEKN